MPIQPPRVEGHLVQRVSDIVRGVAASVVMPSFRSLRPEDVQAKQTPGDPEDLVTIVDHAAERRLIEQLDGLVPDAAFVGEEAACAQPAVLDALARAAPAWLIDPIDGTKNFANGNANFGVMVALVENGVARASWMAVPAALPRGYIVVAQQGIGTSVDGRRIDRRDVPDPPRGSVHTRMAPPATARALGRALEGKYRSVPSTGSAATEYSAILHGDKDFVIYYRLLPWDHAPGALAVTEAGGAAMHLSGRPYTPLSLNQVTIFAASPDLAETIRAWLADMIVPTGG